jgi:hypothetical protein
MGSQSAKPIRDSGASRSKSPNVLVQSDPVRLHEMKAWQSGGVHVPPFATRQCSLNRKFGAFAQVRIRKRASKRLFLLDYLYNSYA